MASKPAAAAATPANAEKGAASVQIMQHLASIQRTQDELKTAMTEMLALLTPMTEGVKTLSTSVVSLENKVAEVSVNLKAGGTKRAPKAPGSGDGTSNASSPVGEKPPSTSLAWFGQEYKKNVNIVEKYLTVAQIEAAKAKLAATDAYTKLDPTKGTPEQQAKAKLDRSIMETKEYLAVIKADTKLLEKMKGDWTAAKSQWENKSRTPATKDDVADAAPEPSA